VRRAAGVEGAVFALGSVSLLAFAGGGYERGTWRPAILLFACAAVLALVLRGRLPRSAAAWTTCAALLAFAGWMAVSRLWSEDPGLAAPEAERALIYVAAAAAAVALGGALAAGTFVAIGAVCAYSLGARLLYGPNGTEAGPLSEPLGYANALGALAAIGLAAAAVLVLREPRLRAAALVLVALAAATLVLTGSRGGWLAAAVATAFGAALAYERVRLARGLAIGAGLLLAVGLALSAGTFAEELAAHAGDRSLYWHVAWQDVADRPFAGNGAGTFARSWLERGPPDIGVLDAHSLYLETLAELGVVGLLLMAAALAPPLLAVLRRPVPPATASAGAAYVAFLLHAGLDWDWEMPAVTVAGLFCGLALVTQDRRPAGISTGVPDEGAC
jgi:O-antigen ligase